MKIYVGGLIFFVSMMALAQPLPQSIVPANSVTLAWNESPSVEAVGYRIYWGSRSGAYTNSVAVGNVTNATITGLVSGVSYYFAASAYDATGMESVLSNEATYTVSGGGGGSTNRPTLAIRINSWEIAWQSVVGATNVLQWSTNMTAWNDYLSFIGTNGTTRVVVPNDSINKNWRTTTR